MSEKAREFWIMTASGREVWSEHSLSTLYEKDIASIKRVANHVIEYSAVESLQSELEKYKQAYAELSELSEEFLEVHDEPCRLDHHGCCQSHFLEEDCLIVRTKQALESARKILNEQTDG